MHLAALPSAVALLVSASQALVIPDDQHIPPSLDLGTLANNSLFTRWRPTYHVAAPAVPDPCGPMYDPLRDTYHIFYQAFPQHVNFGNTTWGHATSRDLIIWQDVGGWQNRSFVAIEPGPSFSYDWLGAFSGGAYPGSLFGEADGNLTVFYTGSLSSPDFWRKPYKPNSETQNAATSSDGGRTWQKWQGNPILNGAPGGWNVTGMRDPIPARIPELARVLGDDEDTFYITIGSGIRGVGPRAPLWKAPKHDLTDWSFQGSLFEVPVNYTWGPDGNRTGSFGGNFEMATFYPLVEKAEFGGDGETLHWVYTFGAEGFESFGHDLTHWSLFALGDVTRRDNGSAAFSIRAAGPGDWGNGYAVNTFWDSKNERRVAWGWSDEDFNGYGVSQNGYQGSLLLPRELYVRKVKGVVAPAAGAPNQSAEIWEREHGRPTYTVTTLAQRPLPDVVAGIQQQHAGTRVGDIQVTGEHRIPALNSSTYHLRATLDLAASPSPLDADPTAAQFGFKLRAAPADEEFTSLLYTPANNTLVLNRARSSLITNFTHSSFNAYLEPFLFPAFDNETADPVPEPLTFDIFVDASLLEVFVNDRVALSTRVYPSRADALQAALVATEGSAAFRDVTYWDTMTHVWPRRPTNSSGELHTDPWYETHVTMENEWVEVGTQVYDGY
ncbi:glycoside hydrolase family 32 protein [Diplodia corticola]|uniref:Glycoside hydrolase family 32 protein n=1 Tax=Diplodia corticola TaxID=236234 RepID=A0A1J9QU07_9PEZI|nr:glycoside hydrolase family 32 protein [Diplodia corticola]OJD31474.1 glycoside hydrolase family 32 protein [Diplodia corticola]